MYNTKPTLKYIWLTVKHKVFVFRAGLRTKAPLWRLIIHDWSKFTPSEAPHYGRQFFGDKSDPEGMESPPENQPAPLGVLDTLVGA